MLKDIPNILREEPHESMRLIELIMEVEKKAKGGWGYNGP